MLERAACVGRCDGVGCEPQTAPAPRLDVALAGGTCRRCCSTSSVRKTGQTLPDAARLVVANLVEGLVAIGGVLPRHPQYPLADDIALHLVATSAQAESLSEAVGLPPSVGIVVDPGPGPGTGDLEADVEVALGVGGGKEAGYGARRERECAGANAGGHPLDQLALHPVVDPGLSHQLADPGIGGLAGFPGQLQEVGPLAILSGGGSGHPADVGRAAARRVTFMEQKPGGHRPAIIDLSAQ